MARDLGLDGAVIFFDDLSIFCVFIKKSNPSTDLFLRGVCPSTTAGCALDFALSFICLNHDV